MSDAAPQPDDQSATPRKPRPHLFNVTMGDLPEMQQFRSEADRQAALWEMGRDAGNPASWRYWAAVASCAVGALAVGALARFLLGYVIWPPWVERLIYFAAMGGGLFLIIRYLHRRGARQELRAKLRKSGVPVCLKCGYNLTGNTTGVCPECGEPSTP